MLVRKRRGEGRGGKSELNRVWGGLVLGKEIREKDGGGGFVEGVEELEGIMNDWGDIRVGGVEREEMRGRKEGGGVVEK